MTKFIILFISLLFFFVVHSCKIEPSHPSIQYVGRIANTTDGVAFSWSGVTITASFSGTRRVSVYFIQTSPKYFKVFINGFAQPDLYVSASTVQVEYTLASTLNMSNTHVVTLISRNEATFGVSTFTGFSVSEGGQIEESPARPSKLVEFIGDSNTAAYGNIGTSPCSHNIHNQDIYQSHGVMTAQNLGSDFLIHAWSGLGLVRNYNENGLSSSKPFPYYYNLTVGGNETYGEWNFPSAPQAIIINLGSNDVSTAPRTTEAIYINGYQQFINKINEYYYPSSPLLFLVCGPIQNLNCPWVRKVAYANNYVFINYYGASVEPYGCDNHPSVATHLKLANAQSGIVAANLGWSVVNGSAASVSKYQDFIYDNSLVNGWMDWSWCSTNLSREEYSFSSPYSISMDLTSYCGLYFRKSSSFNITSYSAFIFRVYVGDLENVNLKVSLYNSAGVIINSAVPIVPPPVPNQWNTIRIPIAKFSTAYQVPIFGIAIQHDENSSRGFIYIDNVYFAKSNTIQA